MGRAVVVLPPWDRFLPSECELLYAMITSRKSHNPDQPLRLSITGPPLTQLTELAAANGTSIPEYLEETILNCHEALQEAIEGDKQNPSRKSNHE